VSYGAVQLLLPDVGSEDLDGRLETKRPLSSHRIGSPPHSAAWDSGGLTPGMTLLGGNSRDSEHEQTSRSAPSGKRGGGAHLKHISINELSVSVWEKWYVPLPIVMATECCVLGTRERGRERDRDGESRWVICV